MSTEIKKANRRRKYRKRRRAEQEEATRLRITEALVELHGSVGPARTTIRDIADHAGVQRATVYRHFPDEPSMYAACSRHWAEQNPFPDPASWAGVADRSDRLRLALTELYAFFERNERMLDNTTRDATRVPALAPAVEAFRDYLRAAADVVVGDAADAERQRLRAAVGHAVAFSTWQSLVRDQGLDRDAAIALMTAMVAAASAAGR